jgi:hypothetical protein
MPERRIFRAFFSYAHDDEAEPEFIEALTKGLETRVNIQLVNDRFEIWRDKEGLRIGDIWSSKLESVLRASDILIVLLTPRWVGSSFCAREYSIFEEVEAAYFKTTKANEAGLIVPVLARDIEKRKGSLTTDQQDIYLRLMARQHQPALASDFLRRAKTARVAILDKIAEDIIGMLERKRNLQVTLPSSTGRTSRRASDFYARAHNYREVDFVSNADVVLDPPLANERCLRAQFDFVEHLYVQGKFGRFDFGVQRAYISISNEGPGALTKVDQLKGAGQAKNASYRTLLEAPDAITVCIDPSPDKSSLGEISLPPAPDSNYLSTVAEATPDVVASQLSAELIVSLNAEGLRITDESIGDVPTQLRNKIRAIMSIAAAKTPAIAGQSIDREGKLRRKLSVGEGS